ncbi:YHYH protein [Candidatus Uabimicrobium amorphum]|uniref:YHYH domain-containing protein n=1 Tax=Uabimicrobium amorphum TaxID=2596890 RepID=A0A5S9ILP8_UABAM|nr:YHYH protein [Candidatus Uabimicrobium amorphum]BBM83746.1 hypothetical protein UABAM_02100 [Candidatus Uabimicrobium amorphum]
MSYKITLCIFVSLILQSIPGEELKSFVNIETRRGYRYIFSNGIPSHNYGSFPNRNNPNRISQQRHVYRVSAVPQRADQITPVQHQIFGVAINGVPFDPGTAEFWQRNRQSGWRYEALSGKINLGLDMNNAHVQPNGAYHYHGIPWQWLTSLTKTPAMTLVGYAADGFPIYALYGERNGNIDEMRSSYKIRKGMRRDGPGGYYDGTFVADYEYIAGSGDLDECNGKFGATPEYPNGTYHYYLTKKFPFIPRYFRGTPDFTFNHRQGPGQGREHGRRRQGHRRQGHHGHSPHGGKHYLLSHHFRYCEECHEIIRENNIYIGRPPQWENVPQNILQQMEKHAQQNSTTGSNRFVRDKRFQHKRDFHGPWRSRHGQGPGHGGFHEKYRSIADHFRYCEECHELIRDNNIDLGGPPPNWENVPQNVLQQIAEHAKE